MALEVNQTRERPTRGQVFPIMRPSSRTLLSPGLKQFTRDYVIGLSLANLVMLSVWSTLLTRDANCGYALRHPPRPVDLVAAMLGVGLLAGVFCTAATIARRSVLGVTLLEWGVMPAVLLVGNAVREVLANSVAPGLGVAIIRFRGFWHAGVMVELAGVFLFAAGMLVWRGRVVRMVSVALLCCSPFVLVTFSETAIGILRYNPLFYADKPLAARVQAGFPERRVLWLIFDELDERLAFVDRDPVLRLPELDRFRTTSFSATQAWSPANNTPQSIPSLLTGEVIVGVRPSAPDDLVLHYAAGGVAHWQNEPNVFSRARALGYDTALAGWYHPYGRVLNNSLTECAWVEIPNAYNSKGNTLAEVTIGHLRSLVETGALSPFGQSLAVRHQVRNYHDLLAAATDYAGDPRLGMTLLHFPIPHPPYIYNLQTGRLDLANSPIHGYIDALALVDRTLGELRRTMEEAGLWERTAVLISADHGYPAVRSVDGGKIADRWVPFLLKLPGQNEPYEYPRRLETIRSARLLLDILEGRIKTSADVARSLDDPHSGN